MTIVNETDSVEVALSHHGVKGQRWGERKAESYNNTQNKKAAGYKAVGAKFDSSFKGQSTAELMVNRAKIQARINKLNMDTVISGYTGKNSRKDKAAMKQGLKTGWQKTSSTDKQRYYAQNARHMAHVAEAKTIAVGATEAAAVLVGGNFAMSKLHLHANSLKEGRVAVLGLTGVMAVTVLAKTHAISENGKYNELSSKRDLITKELNKRN